MRKHGAHLGGAGRFRQPHAFFEDRARLHVAALPELRGSLAHGELGTETQRFPIGRGCGADGGALELSKAALVGAKRFGEPALSLPDDARLAMERGNGVCVAGHESARLPIGRHRFCVVTTQLGGVTPSLGDGRTPAA